MDSYWESQTLSNDIDEDSGLLPLTNEPVTILGRQYSALYDREDIRADIVSRIWCTYRKNFAPIGGVSGFTSDMGWGCMHRCGQMMLAQALVMIHLGRDWRWYKGIQDETYQKIITMFHDNRKSLYSIHMISLTGESEGKPTGRWFGPNTVAQVLKKISKHNKSFRLEFHITMEDGIIIDEIVAKCKTKRNKPTVENHIEPVKTAGTPHSKDVDDNCVEIIIAPTSQNTSSPSPPPSSTSTAATSSSYQWRPLLLIVPVRLGLNELNPCYIPALKDIFQLPHCVGILGGRPSHALWFIGQLGDDLIYLDPHVTQQTAQMSVKMTNGGVFDSFLVDDSSYHCSRWGRMPVTKLDPSLALAFIATSELQLIELCQLLNKRILIPAGDHPMFEIHQKRPYYFPKLTKLTSKSNTTVQSKPHDDENSTDEFELL